MIKIILKHYLYDYCISLIFSKIKNNFTKIKGIPRHGEKFASIEFKFLEYPISDIYYDCTCIPREHKYFAIRYKKQLTIDRETNSVLHEQNIKWGIQYFSKKEFESLIFKK